MLNNFKKPTLLEKTLNKVIKTLMIILVILIIYIIAKTIIHKFTKDTTLSDAKKTQVETQYAVDKWKIQEKQFISECQKINKTIVLEGDRQIICTYSTTQDEIKDNFKFNAMHFLVKKLNELKTKEITVSIPYRYQYVFNNAEIIIKRQGERFIIPISKGMLQLNPLTENKENTIIYDKTRLLSGKFSPQETQAVMSRTYLHTYNQIASDNKLQKQAMDSAMNNIKKMADKFDISVEFEVFNDDLVENEEVEVINK